jgi:hypothetical protein
MAYDPMKDPDPAAWLALSENERLEQVQAHHQQIKAKLPNAKLHAVVHVTVENQLAEALGPAVRAMARLRAAGLDRHEALHAIANVLSQHIFGAMKLRAVEFDHAAYALELELLNLERLEKGGGADRMN